jgi:hypothetical protein
MNSRTKTSTMALATMTISLLAVLVTGCSMDRWIIVEPGEYAVVQDEAGANMTVAREILRLEIDRDESLMVLTMIDGSEIVAALVPRDRTEWPAGCPTNIHSTRMEVLDIVPDPLNIGATRLSNPILVRDCPPAPVRIALREDGAIGGGRTGCPYPEPCIFFAPAASTAFLFPTPLAYRPTGHELNSWQAGRQWHLPMPGEETAR